MGHRLHASGYEHTTVHGTLGLLSRILADAVEDALLPANPVHHHRNRGKRARHIPREMLWATPKKSSAALFEQLGAPTHLDARTSRDADARGRASERMSGSA